MQKTYCAVVQHVATLRQIQKLIFPFVNQLVHSLSFILHTKLTTYFEKKKV
jgi:hypothetical protein